MQLQKEAYGPHGDPDRYLPLAQLRRQHEQLAAAPTDRGTLDEICLRLADGSRQTPTEAFLSEDDGLVGDGWARRPPRDPLAQITAINTAIADLIANGQSRTLFGDNLFLSLDLSADNLPPGSEVAIGSVRLVVTPEPHNGCAKFHARFGADALRFVQDRTTRHLNFRGIHFQVLSGGEIRTGMDVEVLRRAPGV